MVSTMTRNFINGFPHSGINGAGTIPPAHFPMDISNTSRWGRGKELANADHLPTLWVADRPHLPVGNSHVQRWPGERIRKSSRYLGVTRSSSRCQSRGMYPRQCLSAAGSCRGRASGPHESRCQMRFKSMTPGIL